MVNDKYTVKLPKISNSVFDDSDFAMMESYFVEFERITIFQDIGFKEAKIKSHF